MNLRPRYPGVRITANGNQLVSYHTETRVADAGVFYPITPSTEGGELYQQAFAEGKLNAFGRNTIAIEAEDVDHRDLGCLGVLASHQRVRDHRVAVFEYAPDVNRLVGRRFRRFLHRRQQRLPVAFEMLVVMNERGRHVAVVRLLHLAGAGHLQERPRGLFLIRHRFGSLQWHP